MLGTDKEKVLSEVKKHLAKHKVTPENIEHYLRELEEAKASKAIKPKKHGNRNMHKIHDES